MKKYVVGFLFTHNKKNVILIRKNKPEWQKGLLNGVGGKIEKNETPDQAMTREFYEETGLIVILWNKICTLTTSDKSAFVTFYSAVATHKFEVITTTDEPVISVPVKNLYRISCIPNLRWLIPMCLDPDHVSGNVICTNSMP